MSGASPTDLRFSSKRNTVMPALIGLFFPAFPRFDAASDHLISRQKKEVEIWLGQNKVDGADKGQAAFGSRLFLPASLFHSPPARSLVESRKKVTLRSPIPRRAAHSPRCGSRRKPAFSRNTVSMQL